MKSFVFAPIGLIRTPYSQKFGTPRQAALVPAAKARIELFKELQPHEMLKGLADFSHIWIISCFHENTHNKALPKVHPPRLGGASVGVLASRSPHRPNPIGLSLAKLEKIEAPSIWVSGIDLLDGTPVLDIKPYIKESDLALNSHDGWVSENPWPPCAVQFSVDALAELEALGSQVANSMSVGELKKLVEQSLSLDPRAVTDREHAMASRGQRPYWLRLYNLDFGFSLENNTATILSVRAVSAP